MIKVEKFRDKDDKMVRLYHEILKNLSDKEQSDSYLTYNKGMIYSEYFSMKISEDCVTIIPRKISKNKLKELINYVNSLGFSVKSVENNSVKSSFVKNIKDSDVYILMTSDYKSYRQNHGLTKIDLNNAGWVRCYFDISSANRAIKRKDHYYDVYKIHVKNGKILPGFTLVKGE